ncbi:SOS response-associated peptidase [Paraburkholderia sp. CNPSo 3274]|uniref:SOS response-associated peptidase n=1 Tax=Paraburkholderia sp. CNPSo 3274 TaxID=2940932 RepID=UPI0020B85AD6|nr:SOS response-associated peptidase family protein [Paraburkholderia sp. CNPSo 3274]MCP3713189.1 SOS response-associated peptidase [Paraburkholderia sp. CNPSo 3274]
MNLADILPYVDSYRRELHRCLRSDVPHEHDVPPAQRRSSHRTTQRRAATSSSSTLGSSRRTAPGRDEIYKDYAAPIIRRVEGNDRADLATFGIVPRCHIPEGVKAFDTMNARSETVGEKRSFSGAWKKLQLALIPCEAIYEPNYESGKAVRWRIGLADHAPFAVAGLWHEWSEPEGRALSFTMLTLNTESHLLMRRFHKPGAEKRSVIIVPLDQHENWLACRSTDEARSFLSLYPAGDMSAEAAPAPPRKPKATATSES